MKGENRYYITTLPLRSGLDKQINQRQSQSPVIALYFYKHLTVFTCQICIFAFLYKNVNIKNMEIKNYFDKQFELRYFEMNKFGVASPTTMLTLLEETSADHCYAIDHSLYQLGEKDIGWVLVAGTLQMDRYPGYKEKITIRTWLSKYTSIRGFREHYVYDEQGNIIGRGRGIWVFFDIERRRPVQIFDEIREQWGECNVGSIDIDTTKKIAPLKNLNGGLQFRVNKYDTDMYRHVNNIRYLEWVVESVPDEIIDNYYLHSIDGRFIGEANYGETVVSFSEFDASNNSFVHTVKTEGTGLVCATAKSIWRRVQSTTTK